MKSLPATPHKNLISSLVVCLSLLLWLTPVEAEEITMKYSGGVHTVPVTLNETVVLDFVLDSGASTVCITPDILLVLTRNGSVTTDDLGEEREFQLANGRTTTSRMVRLKSVRVGDVTVEDVEAAVSADFSGSLLLGQSFLREVKSWSIDNDRGVLNIEPPYRILTFWREDEEFSFDAGSDWKIQPNTLEGSAFMATDANEALLVVYEFGIQDGAKELERRLRQDREHAIMGRHTTQISNSVGLPAAPAVVLQWEENGMESASCSFRYGGYSYVILLVWTKGVWDGYDGEFKDILSTFRLHWIPEN